MPSSSVPATSSPGTSAAPGTTSGPDTTRPTVPVPVWIDANGFNDHTVPAIDSAPGFFALARSGVSGQAVVKFTIADMTFGPSIHWMDSNFYSLHDEWFWYRLLNGATVAGSGYEPRSGAEFATVSEIYDWALAIPAQSLPYDLQFVGSQSVGNRLYSDHFYDLALNIEPRAFGLGSVVHFPSSPNGGGERWVIELEYQDDPTPDELKLIFELAGATLPAEIAEKLEWVVRSPVQEQLAQTMVAAAMPYHDRIVRYGDLVEPGQVAVYNEGIAAGRLLLIGDGGKDLTDATTNDILLVENVPDFLPQGRALISSSPQTPLAHVNLLARNRGIPNASQAGILQDAGVRQAARVRAPALVRASVAEGLEIVLITESQYTIWQRLNSVAPIAVPQIDLPGQPNVIDLASFGAIGTDAELAAVRPLIGGKAAGFVNLMASDGLSLPEHPMVITVRPYFEHMRNVEEAVDAILANSSFAKSRRTRYLVLEGPAAFGEFYTRSDDRVFAEAFSAANPPGTLIGDVLTAGGLVDHIRDVPMSASTLADITATLQRTYGHYAPTQGLRFRSSSTVEDIEGFNGAGLYDSNSGYFSPETLPDAGDHKRTIERAIKKTWASYWGFEAFEERRREGVSHKSGGMGVLVHARFDDPLELSNGVMTLTVLPEAAGSGFSMLINVQDGAVSVSNPDPSLGALPEQLVVTEDDVGMIRVDRIAESNLVEPGVRVLDDTQARQLYAQTRTAALVWLERVNASLPTAQRVGTLTLDFEFKEMAAGWPAHDGNTSPNPARLVIKQARTLEPGLRMVPQEVRDLAIPRDVLARARLVERVSCAVGDSEAVTVEVLTDPLLVPDVGFGTEPFVLQETPLAAPPNADCARTLLYSTPDQFLIEILETGELLNLSQ